MAALYDPLMVPIDWHARFTQQARWTEDIRRHLFERITTAPGQSLLEVGCGTGAVLSSLVQTNYQIHGLDIDRTFLLQAQREIPSARLVHGDAHRLPYTDSTFDIACCHFFLLWVTNPAQVLSEMCRILRPGGWVLALAEPDYGGRIDYPQEMIRLGFLQENALRRQGAETRLGRRLTGLFHMAGLKQVETGVLGGQWHLKPSAEDLAQEWEVLAADLGNELSQMELGRLREIDEKAWQSGERVLFVPTFYALGMK